MKLIRPMSVSVPGAGFTRAAATASYFDIAGVKQTAPANLPRWDYDPSDLTRPPRLLIEKTATNLLLNSSALSTQSVTVTAQAYTLSFYGTGSVTLSGAAVGVAAGTSLTALTTLTFTPTAGTLTLTVAGAVNYANLEAGAAASSWIPTTGAAATRNADVLPSWLTTLQEAVPATYAGGTTYALADLAAVSLGGNGYDVYRSLQPSNTGHAPASSPTWWQRVNTVYGVWSSGTTYTTGDMVTGVGATAHMLFKSIAGGLNKALPAGAASNSDWTYVGATTPWKPFDGVVQDQALSNYHIGYCIQGVGRIDAFAAFNMAAAKVRVMVYDPTDGYVLDSTVSLVATSGINTWATYFKEPIKRLVDAALDSLLGYQGAYTIVSFIDPSGVVGLGEVVLGQELQIGDTQYGASVGIQDYSIKQQDGFGNWTIVKRAYSKKQQAEVWCNESDSDQVVQTLATYRATPIVYWGADQYKATLVYGFYKDFSLAYTYFKKHVLSVQIEGLT